METLFHKDRMARRTLVMCLGILIMGIGIAIFKISLMGNDPSTALAIAVGDWIHLDFSICVILMNCLYFVVEILFGRRMIGVGTFVNWFLVGPIASFFEKAFLRFFDGPQNFLQQLGFLAVGVLVLSFSCALYQTADVGIAPYDSLSLLLTEKTKIPYFWCRIATDAACVGVAFLLGGLIGLGTLVCALGIGPFVSFFTRWAAIPMVYGKNKAPDKVPGA